MATYQRLPHAAPPVRLDGAGGPYHTGRARYGPGWWVGVAAQPGPGFRVCFGPAVPNGARLGWRTKAEAVHHAARINKEGFPCTM